MRINRIDTKAFAVSAFAEESALKSFAVYAERLGRNHKGGVSADISYHYSPVLVLAAVKLDGEGRGIRLKGMENTFHVGLNDACVYVMGEKGVGNTVKETFINSPDVHIERIDFLQDVATLSPKALSTLGYLLDHGTVVYDNLDMPRQTAAKELQGRKYADIYRPVDREGDLTVAFREIIEFQPVTPIYKVKPLIPAPRFMNPKYNISPNFSLTDSVEDDVELERIIHTPEKIMYLLGTMFNCSLALQGIVYMPYIRCVFRWEGKQSAEYRYIPCPRNTPQKKYRNPVRLKTITIGTKGHGLQSVPVEDVAINFSNVAGMEEVKEKLREGIIYPIVHPELSKQFGSKGGGGVLLYGPPGCGKTYIMRATVGEAGVNFYTVSVQDIIGDAPEAAAKNLDDIFNEARAGSPSILFFDEIDALGGTRKTNQPGAERMLINQFLTDMEGVGGTNENVLVVGSTNAPWQMDPALRRSGRFTTQIFIPPPDFDARKALFKVHMKERPAAGDIDFGRLAELTENYSSADVTAICDQATRIPWSESVHGGDNREISMKDFLATLNLSESTLVPWLRLAEKQLRESGESELFPDLSDYVFKRAGGIEMVSQPELKFKDVGGLESVKEEIRNKVVYPLKDPKMSRQYGRTVGGGVMLYGPPGCGKTYIARATAGECEASFFNVKMTDLLSPEEGVTEKRLHSIFERASRNTPAVIFFDEIDAVAGTRSSSEGSTERRLINQFLTEMDGFEKKEGVVVLAATNAPWDIDPALRRAGRFSDQIFLPPPDGKSREEVFGLHIRGLPLAGDVDVSQLAALTDDYSSADIKLVCDEAAKIPWKEGMKTGQNRPITMADFRKALGERKSTIAPWLKQAEKQLRESGESEVYHELSEYVFKRAGGLDAVSQPTLTFAQVGGLDEAKEDIRNKIVYPLKNPELAHEYGRTIGGGILLFGPPGCGKTYIARATAGECKASFFNVKITDLMSPVEGETERKLHDIFERASRNTPAVIFFDEIDAVAGLRTSAGGGAERRLINQFLTEMDGFEKKEGVVVLAATNAPWDIDPALRRAGRFSDQIFLPPPDGKSREEVFRIHAARLPVEGSVDYSKLAQLTGGYSSADLKLICDEAAKIPWKESMETGKKRLISMDDFKKVIGQRPSTLSPWFKQADKEIRSRGEQDDYPQLMKAVREFLQTGAAGRADAEIDELDRQRAQIQMMIDGAMDKYRHGDIDEATLRQLMREYESKAVEFDARIRMAKEKK
jgi:transitional endoplasmic reticulum ATPase